MQSSRKYGSSYGLAALLAFRRPRTDPKRCPESKVLTFAMLSPPDLIHHTAGQSAHHKHQRWSSRQNDDWDTFVIRMWMFKVDLIYHSSCNMCSVTSSQASMDPNNCNTPDLSTQSRTSQVDRKDYHPNHLFDTNATPKTLMDLGKCHLPLLYHYTGKASQQGTPAYLEITQTSKCPNERLGLGNCNGRQLFIQLNNFPTISTIFSA